VSAIFINFFEGSKVKELSEPRKHIFGQIARILYTLEPFPMSPEFSDTTLSQSKSGFSRPLLVLISVFFFWGFVAASNTILIPVFKKHFSLLQWQSQLVDSAFYIAYTVGALIYFLLSSFRGDPLNRFGYKNGLVAGLLISAIGAFGFWPAARLESFPLMLTSLFVVALGFALQQIVANPYVIALGKPDTGSHRVNLAGGINSFGTTIGPLILGYAIFGSVSGTGEITDFSTVGTPYLWLGFSFIAFAALVFFSTLPAIKKEEKAQTEMGAFRFPQVWLGMAAIFVYVGVEVSIQSNLPELMTRTEILGLPAEKTVHFISLYWGCLMIGRWTGALEVFDLSPTTKNMLKVMVPLLAFAVILGVNFIKGSPLSDLINFLPWLGILIIGFFLSKLKPVRTMILFSLMAGVMMMIGILTEGKPALYSFISCGLFCSVMWPCIFSLSIAGLGKYTNQASSLLIMMIMGGAFIPPLQGWIADVAGIKISYLIPLAGFAYLALFGILVKKALLKQNINYDKSISSRD
jgi:MFS transporter, FHS family, L-fucose permease